MKHIKISFPYFLVIFFTINLFASAQDNNDSLRFYSDLALEPKKASDLRESYNYFDTNYKKLIKDGNVYSAVNFLYYKASVLYKNGEYDNSEMTAVLAVTHLDKLKETPYTVKVKLSFYNLLGLIYTEKKNKSKAIELYNNALEIAYTTQDSVKIFNNISLVYKNNGDMVKAKEEMLKAYRIVSKVSDTLTQALVLDNYGVLESEFNKKTALELLLKALKFRQLVNDSSTIYTSYSHLSQYYRRVDSLEKSKFYALRALKLANNLKSPSYRNNALGLLINLSDDQYAKAYREINDSLYDSERESDNRYALIKYDYSKYQQQAMESKLEEQKQRNLKLIYFTIALLIILVSVFFYFFLKAKHKTEKLRQVYKAESRISKKIHDEVANDVYHVISKIQSKNYEVLDSLEKIYNKTRDISRENSAIDLESDYNDYLNDMLLSFMSDSVTVITNNINKVKWNHISKEKKIIIYRVLQELMVNMKKHSNASHVILKFNQELKRLSIDYRDNGVGCTLNKRGGLLNVENRIKAIKGTVTFESKPTNGFHAQIKI